MDYKGIVAEMRNLGFPCAYGSFKKPPSIPYTVIDESNDSDMKADNKNYAKIRGHQLELYTEGKDTDSEKLVEDKLEELGIPYSKYCTEIKSGGLYQTIYEIQLIGG